MINKGLTIAEKFYKCRLAWFIALGHSIKMVLKLHGIYSLLTIVKMATSHMVASILMGSSAKLEASHMIAIEKHIFLHKAETIYTTADPFF